MTNALPVPGVDEITDRFALFSTTTQQVRLTPAIGSTLLAAQLERVPAILLTGPFVMLSAHLCLEMLRTGGRWIYKTAEGDVVDAIAQRRVFAIEEVGNQDVLPLRPPAFYPDAPFASEATLCFDVVVNHRATTSLQVGDLVEVLLRTLGHDLPDAWGSTEPLTRRWDRGTVTRLAQQQMPNSSLIRGSTPTGASFTLHFRRTSAGVNEQVRLLVPIGDWTSAVPTATERATAALQRVDDLYRVIVASVSLADFDRPVDESLPFEIGQRARRRRPEVPLALLLGPWAVREAGIDVRRMVRDHGAITLGRVKTASLLVDLDPRKGAPWGQMAKLVQDAGVTNLAHALGIDLDRGAR